MKSISAQDSTASLPALGRSVHGICMLCVSVLYVCVLFRFCICIGAQGCVYKCICVVHVCIFCMCIDTHECMCDKISLNPFWSKSPSCSTFCSIFWEMIRRQLLYLQILNAKQRQQQGKAPPQTPLFRKTKISLKPSLKFYDWASVQVCSSQ